MKTLINLLPKAKAAGGLFVLGFGVFAFAGNAKAEAVTYSTTGTFNNGSSSITSGGVTLSFTGEPLTATVTGLGSNSYVFGDFSYVAPVNSAPGTFTGDTFTVHIYETVPSVADGNVTPVGSITGELQRLPGGTGIEVVFGPTASFLAGVGPDALRYSPSASTILGSDGGSGSQEFDGTIGGNASRAPLPSSAAAGMALLGLLAFAAKRRMAM